MSGREIFWAFQVFAASIFFEMQKARCLMFNRIASDAKHFASNPKSPPPSPKACFPKEGDLLRPIGPLPGPRPRWGRGWGKTP